MDRYITLTFDRKPWLDGVSLNVLARRPATVKRAIFTCLSTCLYPSPNSNSHGETCVRGSCIRDVVR